MQIDRTLSEVTSSRKSHLRFTEAAQQHTQKIIRSPHLADTLHIYALVTKSPAVNHQCMLIFIVDPNTHLPQYRYQILDVRNMRNILKLHQIIRQKRSRNNGYRSIFGSTNAYGSL